MSCRHAHIAILSAAASEASAPHLPPPCPPLQHLKKEHKIVLSGHWLHRLLTVCLDLPKARPFLISISGPQRTMRSPWCEMRWQYHDLAGHKTTVFKDKCCNVIVYPRGCIIQSNDQEAICIILTFSWTKCGWAGGLWRCGRQAWSRWLRRGPTLKVSVRVTEVSSSADIKSFVFSSASKISKAEGA